MVQNPFDSIESTQEYFRLLDSMLEEVQADTQHDLREAAQANTEDGARAVEGMRLVNLKLHQLRDHVRASRRILNDLRTLRRLLLRERYDPEPTVPVDNAQSEPFLTNPRSALFQISK